MSTVVKNPKKMQFREGNFWATPFEKTLMKSFAITQLHILFIALFFPFFSPLWTGTTTAYR